MPMFKELHANFLCHTGITSFTFPMVRKSTHKTNYKVQNLPYKLWVTSEWGCVCRGVSTPKNNNFWDKRLQHLKHFKTTCKHTIFTNIFWEMLNPWVPFQWPDKIKIITIITIIVIIRTIIIIIAADVADKRGKKTHTKNGTKIYYQAPVPKLRAKKKRNNFLCQGPGLWSMVARSHVVLQWPPPQKMRQHENQGRFMLFAIGKRPEGFGVRKLRRCRGGGSWW